MSKAPKTYAILRVSTTTQDDADKSGLETQRKIIHDYCKLHDYPKAQEVVDVGKSAEKFAQLKYGNLGKLISKLKQERIKPASIVLLFAFSDRFSRAVPSDGLAELKAIVNIGIDIIFIDLQTVVTINEPEQQREMKIMYVLSSFTQNRQAWLNLSNRLTGAWDRHREAWIAYSTGITDVRPSTNSLLKRHTWWQMVQDKNVVNNPTRIKFVKMVFDLFTKESYSILGIARHFNDVLKLERFSSFGRKEKKKNFENKVKWTDTSIKSVLKHRSVIGQHQYFEQVKEGSKRIKKEILNEDGTPLIVENWIEAVIPKEQFFLAQTLLANNSHNKGKKSRLYPLNIFRTLIFSGYSGLSMGLNTVRKNNHYYRTTYAKNIGGLKSPLVGAICLEKAFFTSYKLLSQHTEIAAFWNQLDSSREDSQSNKVAGLKDDLEQLTKANENLTHLILTTDNKENLSTWDKRITDNKRKIEETKKDIDGRRKRIETKSSKDITEAFEVLRHFSKDDKIRNKMWSYLKNTEHTLEVYGNGLKFDEKKLLNKFGEIDPKLGNPRNWVNFDYLTFKANPMWFLQEYIFCLIWSNPEMNYDLTKVTTESFERTMFNDFFGNDAEAAEQTGQNKFVVCWAPNGKHFSCSYNTKPTLQTTLKYISWGKGFTSGTVTGNFKEPQLDYDLSLQNRPHLKDKLLSGQNDKVYEYARQRCLREQGEDPKNTMDEWWVWVAAKKYSDNSEPKLLKNNFNRYWCGFVTEFLETREDGNAAQLLTKTR